jgi:hypothetical protein
VNAFLGTRPVLAGSRALRRSSPAGGRDPVCGGEQTASPQDKPALGPTAFRGNAESPILNATVTPGPRSELPLSAARRRPSSETSMRRASISAAVNRHSF